MNTQKNQKQVVKDGGRIVFMMAFLMIGLLLAGCMSSYRNVRDINQLPAERSATIRVEINTTSEGKILREEIEKDYWELSGGPYNPYPVLNYEWYIWLAMDKEIYPLIPKGRTFLKNVPLIHEGDSANLAREYNIPPVAHIYWLQFAGMRPYVYTSGSSTGDGIECSSDDSDGGDWEGLTRLGLIWNRCFSVNPRPGQIVTVQIDDNGIHLPKDVKVEPASNCNEWLFGPPVETWKKNLP